jgi:hypothetical protein
MDFNNLERIKLAGRSNLTALRWWRHAAAANNLADIVWQWRQSTRASADRPSASGSPMGPTLEREQISRARGNSPHVSASFEY